MKVTFLSPALRDILEAVEYYEEQAAGLGHALDADLTGSLDLMKSMPKLGAPVEAGTRRILLQRFPFAVVYKVLDDGILVVALAHQKERRGYWWDPVQSPTMGFPGTADLKLGPGRGRLPSGSHSRPTEAVDTVKQARPLRGHAALVSGPSLTRTPRQRVAS